MAWILNLGSFFIGLLFYQRPLLNAFLAGRLVKTNLNQGTDYDDVLLNKTVGELRKEILVQRAGKNPLKDSMVFVGWCLISLTYHAALVFILILCLYKLIHILF